jgi:hypothetical protein
MEHWPSYLYIYPAWTDIMAYYTDRITDVTVQGLHVGQPKYVGLARINLSC